jgi:hypothetical protein
MLSIWHAELQTRNPLLAKAGWVCFLFGCIALFLPLIDSRELLGQYVWIKPAKFFFSVGIFFWTMGWLMDHLSVPTWVQKISLTSCVMLSIELVIITVQAARGTMSHFNNQSVLDGILFGIMGLAITINSFLVILIWVRFFKVKDLPSGYLWGVRLGIFIFLIAGYQGFLMTSLQQHTVGGPDGQEGLLFLGWAKYLGDLRVFHFFGIHALQLLPILSWYFFREKPKTVILCAIVYFLVSTLTLWMALSEKGIFSWLS